MQVTDQHNSLFPPKNKILKIVASIFYSAPLIQCFIDPPSAAVSVGPSLYAGQKSILV